MRTLLRGVAAALTTSALVLAGAGLARADTVHNDIVGPGTVTMVAGQTAAVGYYINAAGGTCDAADGSDATLTVNAPADVTVTPSSRIFSACKNGSNNNSQSVTFQSNKQGTYLITVSVVDAVGSYNTTPATFTLTVTPAPDSTPPVINYVLDPSAPGGSNGWYTGNVSLTWTVTDPESTVTKTGCVDQAISTDQGPTTYSCSASSAGGSAGPVTVSIKRDATAPTVSWTGGPASGGTYVYGSVPSAPTCSAVDAISGPDSCAVTGYSADAGTHTMTATAKDLAGNTATSSRTYTVEKAAASCSVSGWSGIYDGLAHGASGSCVGVNGESAGSLDLGASFTNVPGGSAHWVFTGNGNYTDQFGDVTITIEKAPSTVTVTCPAGIYDGLAHGASGSCVGVNGESAGSLDLGASFTNVPGGSAHWVFTGNGNYTDQFGDVTITIEKAPSTVTVTCPANVVYTGLALEPCSATVTGAGGLSDSLTVTYANNVNAGTDAATASAAYRGDANHEESSDSTSFTIDKATSTVTVTCPASVVFTGNPITPCSASVTGVGGLNLTLTVTYANNTAVGTATATATYPGDANHVGAANTATFQIAAWTLSGFYQPVDMGGVWNVVKNGSTVPLKFEVFAGTTELTDVSVVASFTAKQVACPGTLALVDDVEFTTTGGTQLRYDATGGQFIQNWQTPKKPGTCWVVTMTTDDGSSLSANFKLK